MLTLRQTFVFLFKTRLFVTRRLLLDLLHPVSKLRHADETANIHLIARSRLPLRFAAPAAEQILQLGKIENLRLAVHRIDRRLLPTGTTFSFWRQVGPPWHLRGFVRGRELRMGCIVPTIGGGLCQLSNALYACARQAGCTIVERHAHTAEVPHAAVAPGDDATVFWNYVDLRFRATRDLFFRAYLTEKDLIVEFHESAHV